MGIFNKNSTVVKFNGYAYAINLDKLKEVCLSSSKEGATKEIQIAQTYEMDDTGELELQTKVEHETRTVGIPQNDMIVYDIVKILIISLLENTDTIKDFTITFGLQIALNTLLSWGILEKVD
jgi:hypothetical protein